MKVYRNADEMTRLLIVLLDLLIYILVVSLGLFIYFKFMYDIKGILLTVIYFLGIAFNIFIFIFYFIILPTKWEKQTIGRALFKCRIVLNDNTEVCLNDLIRRELVGNLVICLTNCICLLGIFIQIVLVFREPSTTISDIIAKTKMVDLKKKDFLRSRDKIRL